MSFVVILITSSVRGLSRKCPEAREPSASIYGDSVRLGAEGSSVFQTRLSLIFR